MLNALCENYNQAWTAYLQRCAGSICEPALIIEGKVTRLVGLTLEAAGCLAAIGERCLVEIKNGEMMEAEVVGFSQNKTYLMPVGNMQGLVPGARVVPSNHDYRVPVGMGLLGRVLDGAGNPIDNKGPLLTDDSRSFQAVPMNPLNRAPIRQQLDVGVRAINGLLSVGVGQRMGLFAGSGVGKSVLLGMMTKYTGADVTVVALIGERGREVKEFVQNILDTKGMQRAVVVAVPADQPPLLRLHGAILATSIAEYFRDQGKQVLLLMDSLTRFAQAQREIALAIGEPPATKGYPPSVFARLPQLVERAGNSDIVSGSITAFYTVLMEGDDDNDPISDAAKAVLDGHIVLSRKIAETGCYPAIDLEASVSRLMPAICSHEQVNLVRGFRYLYSKYQTNRDLINIGMYQKGSDPVIDEAIDKFPAIQHYLNQDMHSAVNISESLDRLQKIIRAPESIK